MIKLKVPYNIKGGLVSVGSILSLPADIEKKMVESGTADFSPALSKVETPPVIDKEDIPPKIDKEDVTQETRKEDITLDVKAKPLNKMTKAELLVHASGLGIEDVNADMKNAEIIVRIEAHGKL